MERIAVIDYGMGNLRSVSKALQHVASECQQILVTSDAPTIAAADRIVFPGQGAIRECMAELDRLGLRDVLCDSVHTRPFLGICIGLQALLQTSEEDPATQGLGVVEGDVRRFAAGVREAGSGERLKVPHMGWNNVRQCLRHPLWRGIADGERFYFVHSYYIDPTDAGLVAARSCYGIDFARAIASAALFPVRVPPDKSHPAGLALLDNFLRWQPTPAA